MDRSGDIARHSSVRRLSLPPDSFPGPDCGDGRSVDVFIPILESHRTRFDELVSVGILELFPLSRGISLPTVGQARRILEKNFPSPVWQASWNPIPFGPAMFLVGFPSRDSLLQAFRCGVLWGRRFSCSMRPWSFKEGGSPNLLSRRVFLRISRLPLLLRDLVSVRALVSGFGVLADPLPDFSMTVDWSSLDVAVLVESLEDVPSFISATFGDARYAIRVETRGSEQFFPSSAALSDRHEGEPDWGAAEDELDNYLDDISDPIDLDSDAVEDPSEDPVDDPAEDPGSSSSGKRRLLSDQVPCLLAPQVSVDAPMACIFSRTSAAFTQVQSGELSFRLCLAPVMHGLPLGGFPAAPSRVDFFSTLVSSPPPLLKMPVSTSCASKEKVSSPSVSMLHPLSSSTENGNASPVPVVQSQCPPLVSAPGSSSKPRRLKAVLSVRMAAAKTVSQKKAAAFLPLAGAEPELLLSWLKRSGFGVEEGSAGHLISGIRSLEISKSF